MKRIALVVLSALMVFMSFCSCASKEPDFGDVVYHIQVDGLTIGQYNYLAEYKNPDYGITDEIRQAYVIVDTVEEFDEDSQKYIYSVKIRFGKLEYGEPMSDRDKLEVVDKYYDWFMENYASKLDSLEPSGSNVVITTSPLYEHMKEEAIPPFIRFIYDIFGE